MPHHAHAHPSEDSARKPEDSARKRQGPRTRDPDAAPSTTAPSGATSPLATRRADAAPPSASKMATRLCLQILAAQDNATALATLAGLLKKDRQAAEAVWACPEFLLVILQILTEAFYQLSCEELPAERTGAVSNALAILQQIVRIPAAKEFFARAQLDYCVYPLLLANDAALRAAALQLFHSVLVGGAPESLRSNELLPLLLKTVDTGDCAARAQALDVLDLVLQGAGLDYAVQTLDRFQAIDVVLSTLVTRAIHEEERVLLKSLLKIYGRLCERANVRQKLREKLPEGLDSKEALALYEADSELNELYRRLVHMLAL